ncbi:MAG: acyl-CoA/acyl-ACP dehydrogenase [Actinobacteria bacterium]|nr:acyl-CoA/acyl-ACP dehydrogenase [Actinomycetota bacterium]
MGNGADDIHTMLRGEVHACVRRGMRSLSSYEAMDPASMRERLGVMAGAGYLGILVPTMAGGEGGGWQEAAIVVEETARAQPVLALMLSSHLSCCHGIMLWAPSEQAERFLPPLAAGAVLGGVAITEPEAGSDYDAVQTRMERSGGDVVVNGNKCFVTNTGPGFESGILAVIRGETGLASMYIPADTPGFHLVHHYRFAGWDNLPNHAVLLQDCKVGGGNLLCDGLSRDDLRPFLAGGRLLTVAVAAGMSWACLEEASSYGKERNQGGRKIVEHQAVYFRLADMATSIASMHTCLLQAAACMDSGGSCLREINMLKLFSTSRLEEIASSALETAGAYGYTADSRLSSLYRDAKGLQLHWGSRDLMRMEIAADLGLETA